ncbi:hypothetical protein BC567DRAFT_238481, partial [Phyllosticta citribraziliensis]
MVLQNIWVYSSLGSVQDIRWADDTVDLFNTMPSVVLVALDKYNVDGYNPGDYDLSFFDLDPEGKPVVPIFPAVHTFMFGGARCSRTQFPLTTANTITIHKTWSISVDLVVVNFDHRGSTPVLSYVAVLRVRSLQGLIVEEPIDYEISRSLAPPPTAALRDADDWRRSQLLAWFLLLFVAYSKLLPGKANGSFSNTATFSQISALRS